MGFGCFHCSSSSLRAFYYVVTMLFSLVSYELVLTMLFLFSEHRVELAQLLVHDDITMEKFKKDHNIPNGIVIERLGPREEANNVEGEEDRISVRIWLIHQVGLRFPSSPLLKEVMARCRLTFRSPYSSSGCWHIGG